MFDLYPNVLMVARGSSEHDENGDVPSMAKEFAEVGICMAVKNGSGQMITLSGGVQYRYEYVVYMPVGTLPIKDGTPVKVYDGHDDSLLTTGKARSFISSPIGCKMWI
ncbi:MAG: hypothetical protein PHD21_05930 [Flavobacteriales bacterium]|nr:hypothetical protein [Flavobacteriales bacterium]